jgi:hypothetical protein
MKAFLITLLALFFLTASLAEALESALSIDLGFAFPLGKMAGTYGPPKYGWNQKRALFFDVLFTLGMTNHLKILAGANYSLNHVYKDEWNDPQYQIPYSKVLLIFGGLRYQLLSDAKFNPYADIAGGLGVITYKIADNWGNELSTRYSDPALYMGGGLAVSVSDNLLVDIPIHLGIVFWKPKGDEVFMPGWTKGTIDLFYVGAGFTYLAL